MSNSKRLIPFAFLALTAISSFAQSEGFFFNARSGIAFNDTDSFVIDNESFRADFGHPWRLNLSLGYKPKFCKKYNCKVGISHESSPLSGRPFNDEYDYFIDQVFFELELVLR